MDLEETMVENEALDNGADDTLPEDVVEEPQDESEDLEAFTEAEEQPAEEKTEEQSTSSTEPGWIKKRVEKAVTKAIAETEARMQAMFDKQMAPIRERIMEEEAQELVRSRKVSDIETARELVRLRNGQPTTKVEPRAAEQPRQANGQFAPKNVDSVKTEARIDELKKQAEKIKNKTGLNVIDEFTNNPEIKKKVVSGDWDFYDVADYLKDQKPSRKPPSPMRSPNGASGTNPNAIDSMSDEQFRRMEKRIAEGARIRLSK